MGIKGRSRDKEKLAGDPWSDIPIRREYMDCKVACEACVFGTNYHEMGTVIPALDPAQCDAETAEQQTKTGRC